MFEQSKYYSAGARRRLIKSPVKLRHIWLPLTFLLVCLYRNQAIHLLSVSEVAIGLGITIAAFLPVFLWSSKLGDREPPAFQCCCLIFFPYYGYPILCSKPEYMMFSESVRLIAGSSVLLFLLTAIAVYHLNLSPKRRLGPAGFLEDRRIPEPTERVLFTLLMMVWFVYIVGRNFGYLNFGKAQNVANIIAMGNGLVAAWVLARLSGEGKLSTFHTGFLVFMVGTGLIVSFANGSLALGFMLCMVAIVSFTLGSGRIPWVVICCILGVVAFLNLGKGEMRAVHWRHGPPILSLQKISEVYGTWLPASSRILMGGTSEWRDSRALMDRMNLIHMQALVVSKSPDQLPFLWGKTYWHIPVCLVPRPLWPTKPHGHISTETLGVYYGATSTVAARKTTIGLGLLAEAWGNFGFFGIIGLGILNGFVMRIVANGCEGAHPSSLHALLSVVWVGWSFQIEGALSQWIASLMQTVLAILVMAYPVSRSVRDYLPSRTRNDSAFKDALASSPVRS